MDGNEWGDTVFARDRTYSSSDVPIHRFRFVAPGYFKTLGTPFIAGRDVTWSDIYHKVPVAIVSEKLAREYWHNPSDALGKQVRANPKDDWREVVGVVAPTFTVMSPPGTTPDTTRVRVGTPSPGGAV